MKIMAVEDKSILPKAKGDILCQPPWDYGKFGLGSSLCSHCRNCCTSVKESHYTTVSPAFSFFICTECLQGERHKSVAARELDGRDPAPLSKADHLLGEANTQENGCKVKNMG